MGEKTRKRKKKKPRLPKGFDPANPPPPPDPERWVPKWQRSDAKKKKNRRREKVRDGLPFEKEWLLSLKKVFWVFALKGSRLGFLGVRGDTYFADIVLCPFGVVLVKRNSEARGLGRLSCRSQGKRL